MKYHVLDAHAESLSEDYRTVKRLQEYFSQKEPEAMKEICEELDRGRFKIWGSVR